MYDAYASAFFRLRHLSNNCGIFLTTKKEPAAVVRIYSVEARILLNFEVEVLFSVLLATTDSQTL